ncbi:MAG: hypothetical protein ABIY35_05375 [Chitinophagaceae bacterium]
MPTIDAILNELKNVPVEKLGDLFSIIHSLSVTSKVPEKKSMQILSFAGSFNDMTEKDYNEFLHQTGNTRNNLFDRDIHL